MKRFILVVENLSEEDENILIDAFNRNNLGWWHWIDNVWLLTGHKKDIYTSNIRNEVQNLVTSGNILVLEINKNIDWSGVGPTSENRNMFDWIINTWQKKI